eukprot:CAMPEP_0177524598 /NCGR_PEP_ID=MMETSP0369-20130122/50061_1 /TAXON_ID=447022 ORGANISM="Scrippsiella hangoei-like, Strain SHHI-4" /NCGR_SAMPLE_ID=MMETSP0369 /ASSEMBLY_ACC=CAM_ASM_000364 /LENGTH=282 /DNA_ID=CAMNT_0019004617 /DNA_START=293 /DNA_END=1142 /DNA_ORIENTATION=+
MLQAHAQGLFVCVVVAGVAACADPWQCRQAELALDESAFSTSSAGRSIFRLFAAKSSNHRSTSASDLGWAKEVVKGGRQFGGVLRQVLRPNREQLAFVNLATEAIDEWTLDSMACNDGGESKSDAGGTEPVRVCPATPTVSLNSALAKSSPRWSISRSYLFKLALNRRLAANSSNHRSASAVDLGWEKERSNEVGGLGASCGDPIACICADNDGNSDSDAGGMVLVRMCLVMPLSSLRRNPLLAKSSPERLMSRLCLSRLDLPRRVASNAANHRSTSDVDLG